MQNNNDAPLHQQHLPISDNLNKFIVIIAGPNGAGKTTLAKALLPLLGQSVPFLNADIIAMQLSPRNPEGVAFEAGKQLIQKIEQLTNSGHSFCLETTLSGQFYRKHIPTWQRLGYDIHLIYLPLIHLETAIKRVAQRVLQGGHNIDKGIIKRRFTKSRQNLSVYQTLCQHNYSLVFSLNHLFFIKQGSFVKGSELAFLTLKELLEIAKDHALADILRIAALHQHRLIVEDEDKIIEISGDHLLQNILINNHARRTNYNICKFIGPID